MPSSPQAVRGRRPYSVTGSRKLTKYTAQMMPTKTRIVFNSLPTLSASDGMAAFS